MNPDTPISEPQGKILLDEKPINLNNSKVLVECLMAGLLCNDSYLEKKDGQWQVVGVRTEGALIAVANKVRLTRSSVEQIMPRLDVIPFESEFQYMATLHESPGVIANVDDINNNVGFWQPQPDFRIAQRVAPGLNDFPDIELEAADQDLVETFVPYQTDVLLRAIAQNPDADIVLGYIEQPDGSGHQFLLTDPRQPTDPNNPNSIGTGQDQAKVERYAPHKGVIVSLLLTPSTTIQHQQHKQSQPNNIL